MIYLMMASLLSLMIIVISFVLAKKLSMNLNKILPFECGFETFSTARIPFSLRFFKITLIFLIFDIEIILIIPSLLSMSNNIPFILSFSSITIIIILGLIYEWKLGTLNWLN